MKYKFLDHTADVMFEAYGKNLENLFVNAALATESIMVNMNTLGEKEDYTISLDNEDVKELLYDFLSELIFVKDTEGLLFKKFNVIILHKNKKYELIAHCIGEIINREKHELINDAKAITKHMFEIKRREKDDVLKENHIIILLHLHY